MKTPVELIQRSIFVIRGHKVMIDADLALLYKVPTKVLNQAVGRNASRFPADFMFRLTKEEKLELVTNCDRLLRLKHSSAMPRAFTEQGIAMLSSVLRSERAIQVNIQIIRTFTELRQLLSTHEDLKKKIESMEKRYDENFRIVFEAIKQLLEPPEKPKKEIGYTVKEKQKAYSKSKILRPGGLSLTPQARTIWEGIPGNVQIKLLNNVWCFSCKKTTGIGGDVTGKVAKRMLVLHGKCTRCGGAVARVIENEG
jgi:hypothetical protein